MERKCIVCGKPGKFGYFEEPDEKGIGGMFSHLIGVKPGTWGDIEEYERHYVTLEQLENTDWFKDFLVERNKRMDEEMKELNKRIEEDCLRDYYEGY